MRLATSAMGTRFEFVLCGPDAVRLRAAGEAALAEVLRLHGRLSAFDRASDVSRLNREAGRGWVRLDGELFELLSMCGRVWALSEGAFDVTVGPLMEAWGFRGGGAPPDLEAIAAARGRTGFDKVDLDRAGGRVRYLDPGIQIDLGAMGKGFALDAAAGVLREAGVASAFLHGGTSSCVAIGWPAPPYPPSDPPHRPPLHPEGDGEREGAASGWRVRLGSGDEGPVVSLANAALGVSAPHGRMVTGVAGETVGHVLNPRSGRPVRGVRQAAALAGSAAEADAWSTAALVMGGDLRAAGALDGAPRGDDEMGVSLGVEVESAGRGAWTLQGCWPLVSAAPGHEEAMAGVC